MIPTRTSTLALAAAGASLLAVGGCSTTQERSAELAKNAKKAAAAKAFNVGKTNRDVTVASTTVIKGESANAVVVKVSNRTGKTQVMVPIGLDLYDAKKQSMYTNRIDGLDQALNYLQVVPPGTSWWINNQVPTKTAARVRVRIGTSRTALPKSLPELKVSSLKVADDSGVALLKGKVENLSPIEQKRLTLFAVSLQGGKPIAAGRGVIEKVGAKGSKRQRFNIYFNGKPAGGQLVVTVPPSTLSGA